MKLTCPSVRAVPDRMILMPGGRVAFVEVKRPHGRPRANQQIVFHRMGMLGHPVQIYDGTMPADTFLDSLTLKGPACRSSSSSKP